MDDQSALKIAELVADGVNKRIDTLENGLNERLTGIEGDLSEVRRQTTKTNGRVTRHDAEIDAIRKARSAGVGTWRWRVTTGIAALAAMYPVIEGVRAVAGS